MSEYRVEQLTKERFDILKPLMADCFGMDVDYDYFKWKFLDNPAGTVFGFLAISNESNEVAAYYGVIPDLYVINGERKTIYQSCDTMTHSTHRRKGLFKMLSSHCFDALKKEDKLFIIGFSGAMSTPGFIKFGWKHVFDMKHYFIPRLVRFGSRNKTNSRLEEVTDFNKIEQLISESNSGNHNYSVKTAGIFKWRVSNPRHEYKTIAIKSDNRYTAFATYYAENENLVLFDFNFEDIKSSKVLVSEMKRVMHEQSLKGILAYVQEESRLAMSLKKVGFVSNPFSKGPLSVKNPFIFFSSIHNMQAHNDKSKWLIGSFDHDAM